MQGHVENWFATNLLIVDASEIVEDIKGIFAKTNFAEFANPQYSGGVTTYHCESSEPLFRHPESQALVNVICDAVSHLAFVQGVDTDMYRPVVSAAWMTQMGMGAAHPKHVHPNSHFSGTFYVTAPQGCSPIRFYSPIETLWSFCPLPALNDSNPITSAYFDHQPFPGKLAIWNSWLAHEVLPNNTESFRESVSFNINLERIIK